MKLAICCFSVAVTHGNGRVVVKRLGKAQLNVGGNVLVVNAAHYRRHGQYATSDDKIRRNKVNGTRWQFVCHCRRIKGHAVHHFRAVEKGYNCIVGAVADYAKSNLFVSERLQVGGNVGVEFVKVFGFFVKLVA